MNKWAKSKVGGYKSRYHCLCKPSSYFYSSWGRCEVRCAWSYWWNFLMLNKYIGNNISNIDYK